MKTLEQAQRLRNHVLACFEHAAQADDDAERGAVAHVRRRRRRPDRGRVRGRARRAPPARRPRVPRVRGRRACGSCSSRAPTGCCPRSRRSSAATPQKVLERRGVEVRTGTLIASARPRERDARRAARSSRRGRSSGRPACARPADRRRARSSADGPPASWSTSGCDPPAPRTSTRSATSPAAPADALGARDAAGPLRRARDPRVRPRRAGPRAVPLPRQGHDGRGRPQRRRRPRRAGSGSRASSAGLAWLAVHLYYLVGFRNRVAVFFHWGWDYVRRDRPTRMITTVDPDPVVDELTGRYPDSRTRSPPRRASSRGRPRSAAARCRRAGRRRGLQNAALAAGEEAAARPRARAGSGRSSTPGR